MSKVILVQFLIRSMDMLIPKKRGEGYLRQPLGHHNNSLTNFIDEEIGFVGMSQIDVFGLDGYLSFQGRFIDDEEKIRMTETILKPLSEKFYRMPYKVVDSEEFFNALDGAINDNQ